jgi:hypothetical protein
VHKNLLGFMGYSKRVSIGRNRERHTTPSSSPLAATANTAGNRYSQLVTHDSLLRQNGNFKCVRHICLADVNERSVGSEFCIAFRLLKRFANFRVKGFSA